MISDVYRNRSGSDPMTFNTENLINMDIQCLMDFEQFLPVIHSTRVGTWSSNSWPGGSRKLKSLNVCKYCSGLCTMYSIPNLILLINTNRKQTTDDHRVQSV